MPKKNVLHIVNSLYTPQETPKVKKKNPKGIWRAKEQVVDNCELGGCETRIVSLSPAVFAKIQHLMGKFPSHEWLAYLVGSKNKEGFSITDLLMPKQTIATGTVDVDIEDRTDLTKVVGSIHSHHGMGAFFSVTDDEHIAPNQPVSIVVSKKDWVCKVKQKLPCGHSMVKPAVLQVSMPIKVDLDSFELMVADKISLSPTVQYPLSQNLTGGVWKGFYCVSCHRHFNQFKEVEWKKSAYFCKTCLDVIGPLEQNQWSELIVELQKSDKTWKPKEIAPTKMAQCCWCLAFAPISSMLLVNEQAVCKECYNEAESIGRIYC